MLLRSASSQRAGGDDDRAFTARVKRFNATADALRELQVALSTQAAAVAAQRAATVDLSASLRVFDGARAARPGNDPFAGIEAAIFGAEFVGAAGANRISSEVQGAVGELVAELPKVREAVKRRNAEAASVSKWERKAAAARAAGVNPNASAKAVKRVAECDRQLREAVQRFNMTNAEAVNRMDHIHRNLPAMLCTPLAKFVEITAETLGGQERAYIDAAREHVRPVAERLAETPITIPMDKIDSLPLSHGRIRSMDSSGVGGPTVVSPLTATGASHVEVWDDADFGDAAVAPGTFDPSAVQGASSGNADAHEKPETNSVFSSRYSDDSGRGARSIVPESSTSSLTSSPAVISVPRRRRVLQEPAICAAVEVDCGRSVEQGSSFSPASSVRTGALGAQPSLPKKLPILTRLRALYAFRAQENNELSFVKGDVIEVLSMDDSGWWQGRIGDGGDGYFPVSYCVEMTGEEELEFIKERTKVRPKRHDRTEQKQVLQCVLSEHGTRSSAASHPGADLPGDAPIAFDSDLKGRYGSTTDPRPAMTASEQMVQHLGALSISAPGPPPV